MMNVPRMPREISMPPVKPVKKESKIKRIYEDDNWVIDMIDGKVRVSYFDGNHFVDEVVLSKEFFKEENDKINL
mgnify:CR=1 FL=1